MMESKTVDLGLKETDVRRNTVSEMPAGDRRKKVEEAYGSKEAGLKKCYDAVSKNGDTLELSTSGKKLSDSMLAGCSEAKLKQLYTDKEITKQQYDRIMKMKRHF